ncbi:MAG: hypothetical protein J6J36_05700 [Clostridia bacterium]|nr:hypothetical protein [Clostridia bacterium]
MKSIYDVISNEINPGKEYLKLKEMISKDILYSTSFYEAYSLIQIFGIYFEDWKYRNLYCTAEEFIKSVQKEMRAEPNLKKLLILCDLVVNMRAFVYWRLHRGTLPENHKWDDRLAYGGYKFRDSVLTGYINRILEILNYEVKIFEDYKCYIVKKDDIVEEAINVVDNISIATQIWKYNDFRIEKDVEAKKDILKKLADYFEGKKNEIKGVNNSLYNDISFALNSFNIRHNNKEGKNAKEYIKNASNDELIELYDCTYEMLLMSFRLVELPKTQEKISKIREQYF